MSSDGLSYARLLETNNLIQQATDETYWLCVTRTVQESKLFPVSPYMFLSYLMAFYRYPQLLRKIEQRMPAEDIGDRARNMGIKIQNPAMGWCLPSFYLLGREYLITLGLLRPQDAVDDVITVMDFWKRFQLAWHRNDGHMTNREFGHRAQLLPERRVQVFHADMYECRAGDPLHHAAQAFMAAASQYGFLIACESRVSQHNSGPYKLADGREMIVRDFMDLAESDYPWLDGVAAEVPYNNLTVPMAVEGCHFYLVDDWGSFESEPEFKAHHMVGIGLYTSDVLTEGFVPVGMESRETLTRTFEELTAIAKDATAKLWRRIAGWSRDQMMDAGAIVYFSIVKDLAHVAGVYDMADWMLIDERAERFRPLFNDEYSNACLGELVGLLTHPSQRISEYSMMQHADGPTRMYTPIPYSILKDGDFTRTCGPLAPGITHLAPKQDRYRTSAGVLTAAQYNQRTGTFVPEVCGEDYRYLCETWVKYHHDSAPAETLYKMEQRHSRKLDGRGAELRRAQVEGLRDAAAPATGGRPAALERHLVLHGLAVKKHCDAATIAALVGLAEDQVAALLTQALAGGRVVETRGRYALSPAGRLILDGQYSRHYDAVRADRDFLATCDRFELLNIELKQLITDWQTVEIGGGQVRNEHSDKDYDEMIIARLGEVHERLEPMLRRLAATVPRLAIYAARLQTAIERAENGDHEWVSDTRRESYHTVWFEMHEDLLRILGREREE